MAKRKGHKSAKRGKKRALKTKGIKAKTEPLTLGEFRSVLQKVKSLGLAWTAEFPPRLVAEKPDAEAVLLSHEALKLQRAYPNFPEELGVVTLYILTGKKTLTIAGNQQLLEKKPRRYVRRRLSPTNTELNFSSSTRSKCLIFPTWTGKLSLKPTKKMSKKCRESPMLCFPSHSIIPVGVNPLAGRLRR